MLYKSRDLFLFLVQSYYCVISFEIWCPFPRASKLRICHVVCSHVLSCVGILPQGIFLAAPRNVLKVKEYLTLLLLSLWQEILQIKRQQNLPIMIKNKLHLTVYNLRL